LRGDMRMLSSVSYTTPLLSSAVAAILLRTTLGLPFWLGVVLVVIGSLLSWWAGRRGGTGAQRGVTQRPPVREDGPNGDGEESWWPGRRTFPTILSGVSGSSPRPCASCRKRE